MVRTISYDSNNDIFILIITRKLCICIKNINIAKSCIFLFGLFSFNQNLSWRISESIFQPIKTYFGEEAEKENYEKEG